MQKLILFTTLVISAISLLLLPCAPAQAQTFTKKKVATSGTAKCAVSKGKWTPVKKQGSVFVIKTNASNAEKKSCKSLLLPSKKFSLDDIWGVRKVCLERLHDLVKCIKPNDIQKLR